VCREPRDAGRARHLGPRDPAGGGRGAGRTARPRAARRVPGCAPRRGFPAPRAAGAGGAMIWFLAYAVCVAALFVRVQPPEAAPPQPQRPAPDEPLAVVVWHHRIFYLLLLAAPVEMLLAGGRSEGRLLGLAAFGAGVALYRIAAEALGDAL